MSFQREMSSGFSLCCRADSDALLWPERTSRTTWALNCGVKDRRRRFGMGGCSWEASIDYGTGPIPGAHFSGEATAMPWNNPSRYDEYHRVNPLHRSVRSGERGEDGTPGR